MIRAVLVVLVMLASTAHADRKKAEQLFNRGERAYRAQKFLVAAQAFEQAYRELEAPELAFSAAQAFRRQYRVAPEHTEYVELAIKYYELYLQERKTGGRVGDAADSLEDMKAELRHLEKTGKLGKPTEAKQPMLAVGVELADQREAPSAKLREIDDTKTTQTVAGVKAMIDGNVVEPDVPQPVSEGDHLVRAEAPGYKPVEKRVRVIASVPAYEPLVLEPLPGQLEIATEAGATVIIDGRGVGETPLVAQSLPAGTHVVTVLRAGRKAVAREVKLEHAQTTRLAVALEPTLRRRSVKWVALGAGTLAVLAGTSAGFALYWNGDARDQLALLEQGDQDPQVLADYSSSRDRRDQTAGGAVVMGGAALAVGLTAAWLYYFDAPSAEGVKVVPMAPPTGAGAIISASF